MRHSAILVLLCAALLAAPGCKSGKKLFTPEAVPPAPPQSEGQQIGRASCRERVCLYV